jgi:DNA topoisomerase-3
MGKTLIIAEKPSVARDLAAVLGSFDKRDGFLENGQYIVSWAFGHLVELAEPEDYDQALKRWDIASLPILPGRFKLNVIASSKKQFGVLKSLLRSNGVSEVVNACDAGREGEVIFRRIYQAAGATKPFRRLWLSEATPAAVKEAFRKLRPGRELDNLAAAAEARSRADWLVGINSTRAYTCRHGQLLSVGRVQTPTLARYPFFPAQQPRLGRYCQASRRCGVFPALRPDPGTARVRGGAGPPGTLCARSDGGTDRVASAVCFFG